MDYTGARPLLDSELDLMLNAASKGKYAKRDRLFLLLGSHTGYRASELLAIDVQDVWDGVAPRSSVCVLKGFMKGRTRSRTMPLHNNVRNAIRELMADRSAYRPGDPLFTSQRTAKRLSRRQADTILRKLTVAAGVAKHRVSLHSLRKNFAAKMYRHPSIRGDMARMARLLGHINYSNTLRYLEFTGELEEAVLSV
jgi:integrase